MNKTDDTAKMKALLSKQQQYIAELERKLRIERHKTADLETKVAYFNRLMKKGE